MPQYNKAQIKKIIEVLEQQMATASGRAFDKMERARRDLKSWDGTGALPHEKVLHDLNILDGLDSNLAETPNNVEKPALGDEKKQPVPPVKQENDPRILWARKTVQTLATLLAKESNKEKNNALRAIAKSIEDWAKDGAKGDVPHLKELQELGLLPKAVSAKTATPAVKSDGTPNIPVDTGLRDADRLVKEGRLYDAIQVLKKENTEDAEKRLTRLQNELNRKTKQLVEIARAATREQENDFEGRKQAWRAVRDLNPEYQEAHEALHQIERDEIRFSNLYKAKQYLKEAEEGERSGNLPMLNGALAASQALLARVTDDPSLSDLVDEVQRTTRSIENLRRQTRDRLGVMATAEGAGRFREAYEKTKALIDSSSPPPKIMSEDGTTEQDLNTYWMHIRNVFVSWLRGKALDYVQDAQNVAKSYPELAHQKLSDALAILEDSALAREDGISLEPDKNIVKDEIAKILQGIKEYKDAGDLVRKAQGYSRPSERKDLLLKAQQIFPSYPDLKILLEDADLEYANELARIGIDAVVEAHHLAGQDKFDEALKKITEASSQITAAFPAPKKDTPLYQTLSSLDTEKKNILEQKNIYIDIENQLSDLTKYLKEYDEKKLDGSLKAARTILETLQKKYPGHRLLDKPNAELVARQGDPDNWNSGKKAYDYQDWIGADNAFKEISTSSPKYAEAQRLLQRVRGVLSTIKGREFEEQKELAQSISAYQMAVHIFDGDIGKNYEAYGTDPNTVAYAEESRIALERLKGVYETDKRVDDILKECSQQLESARRISRSRRQLVDKVEPIPLFKKVEAKLREATALDTTRSDKVFELLDQVHEIWLATYLDGLKLVAEQPQKNKTLLQKANLLVTELDEAGLLTGQEALACKVQADALDMEYVGMRDYKTGYKVNLDKLEDNRRKRLSVQQSWPYEAEHQSQHEQKIRELERTIREIVDRRMKSEMERRLNEALIEHGSDEVQSQVAYSAVIEEMENDDSLTGSVSTITGLIRLAWKARDWKRAEAFARRLRENTGADYVAISDHWLTLCKAVQAFSENQVDEALAHCEKLPKNVDKEVRTAKTELENETLNRLVDEAKKDAALATESGYVDAANKYAMAYKISPKSQAITTGLKQIGPRIEKTIIELCSTAKALQLRGATMDDLNTACREAGLRFSALSSFANVSAYLNLKPSQVDALNDAVQELASKRQVWDKVQGFLQNYERDLGAALNQPETLDARRNTGGWKLDPLEKYLLSARTAAGRDVQIARLIETILADWNFKKDIADQLNRSVTQLMDAVANEDFDRVIELSNRLEEEWRPAQRDYGFEGLKTLVYETYPNNLGRVETPARHREIAMRQKQDLEIWSKWALNVKDKYATLGKIQRELQFRPERWRSLGDDSRKTYLDERLSLDEGIGMALKDIIASCASGQTAASIFLDHIQSRPASEPISKTAQSVSGQVESGWTEDLSEFQTYLNGLSDRASKNVVEIEEALKLINIQIKNLQALSRKGGVPRVQVDHVRSQLEKCKQKDPYSREINNVEQILRDLPVR